MKLIKITSDKHARRMNIVPAVKAKKGRKSVALNLPKGEFTAKQLFGQAGLSDVAIFQKLNKMEKLGTIKRVGERKQEGVGRPSALYQVVVE